MGPNRRAQERERAAARAAAEAKRAEAERKAIAEADRIVAIGMPVEEFIALAKVATSNKLRANHYATADRYLRLAEAEPTMTTRTLFRITAKSRSPRPQRPKHTP
jgi:hypothetical protein